MKEYKILMFFALLMSLICFNTVFASNNQVENKKIIYIDPGHGGIDPGATYKGINEEYLTLEISKKLKVLLENNGFKVYLTRDNDYDLANKNANKRKRSDLYNRSKLINNSDAKIYLSIHLNAESTGKWSGPQVFYDNINKNNKEIATYIQDSLSAKTNTNRNIKQIENGYLYKHVKKPGVLIELGFISNTKERNLLLKNEYQILLCKAIVEGIEKYFPNY